LHSSDFYRAQQRAFGRDKVPLRQPRDARNAVKFRRELALTRFFGLPESIAHDIQRLITMPDRAQTRREFSQEPWTPKH
jgi:hypothetical protein